MFNFPFHEFRPGGTGTFQQKYNCYSISMMPGNTVREDVNNGGKIIMPPSALEELTHQNIPFPMLFKLTNKKKNRTTHCGVLEFIAEEGHINLPYWMMNNLLVQEGDPLTCESVTLPVATYSKFQPQSVDFLDISDPKSVLETALRSFACLSTNDMVAISYNNKIYEVAVLETKPGPAVSIIECDMKVEFAPAVGYEEPKPETHSGTTDSEPQFDYESYVNSKQETNFPGSGNRIDGKQSTLSTDKNVKTTVTYQRGIPDYNYNPKKIMFARNLSKTTKSPEKSQNTENGTEDDKFVPFFGSGQPLAKKKSKFT